MPNFEFTDDEIRAACNELGLPQDSFDDKSSERRKIIDYWGSANIVACPGSGKTTVLLVKLLLLSKRMPFDDGSGICVLTHTNVAIDEIKHRLGNKADILFEHPNFFGTFQSFVGKYISRSSIYELYNPQKILFDSDIFEKKLQSSFLKLNQYQSKLHSTLFFRSYNPKILKKDITQLLTPISYITQKEKKRISDEIHQNLVKFKIINRKGLLDYHRCKKITTSDIPPSYQLEEDIKQLIEAKHKSALPSIDENKIENLKSLHICLTTKKLYASEGAESIGGESTATYIEFKALKDSLHRDGYFSYRDSYAFALQPEFIATTKNILSKRFRIILVDEAQDTQSHQMKVLDALFADAITMHFGDPDQAIFNGLSGEESAWDTNREGFEKLPISNSKRFGQAIADCINPFKTELDSIKGRDTKPSLKPLILLYNTPSEAVDLFIDRIKANRLEGIEPKSKQAAKFNLVGHTGKQGDSKSEKSIISSYAPNYSKSNQQPKFHFDNLTSYFQKRPRSEIDSKGTRIYYELFSNALTETLNIAQGSNNSRATLFAQLKDQNPEFLEQFRQASFTWIKGIEQKGLPPIEAKLEYLNFLSKNGYTIPRHNSFFTDNEIKPVDALRQDSNFIVKDGIEIKAGTIHSVKGETHVATMLVETENYKKGESDHFWQGEEGTKLFCGNTYKQPDKSSDRFEKIMKTTYVAMSRPSHLLCVAVPKAKAGCPTCPTDKKAKFNWNIIES